MTNPESEHEDIDKRLQRIQNTAGDFLDVCHFRSAFRVYGELKRAAKSEQRIIPFLNAVFHQMDLAQDLMEPALTREYAVELIALLESEERARLLQPDFPEGAYERTAAWMTACAYENFADATGKTEGYNSEGMHGCITEGIQVCRRTGKLACIRCFGEYATEVYTAADDIELALHHTRSIASHTGPWSNRGDRRWLGNKEEAWLLLLTGQLEPAEASLQRALGLSQAEGVSLKLQSKLRTVVELEAVQLLACKRDPTVPSDPALRGLAPDEQGRPRVPPGEYSGNEVRWGFVDGLRACCRGDFKEAFDTLAHWDRWLLDRKCLYAWFEARLRLIALQRLAGSHEKMEPLARQLVTRARDARDWLTLLRLNRLFDPKEAASPLALLAPLSSGPFAATVQATVPAAPPTAAPPAEPPRPQQPPATPLDGSFQEMVARLEKAREENTSTEGILAEVLAMPVSSITHPYDAARFLHLCQYLIEGDRRGEELWRWAETIAAPFPESAPVVNLLAVLGDLIRGGSEALAALVPVERLDKLFRRSLDLDPNNPRNYARAGAFYLSIDNHGEAERCLARGFRLERPNSFLALRLAEVYRKTERPRDALAVLDMCLREGCPDPNVAWDAAMTALQLELWDALLLYVDKFEEMHPGQPWTCYYRATALLELGRPLEMVAALDEEERRGTERRYPVEVLRACAAAALGDWDRCRLHLGTVLATRLATVDVLTVMGLKNLFERLWKAATRLPSDDLQRLALHDLLLAAGLAPDELFEAERQRGEVSKGMNLYRCAVHQPLDEQWAQSAGCLAGQAEWNAYRIHWGVLARDEDEAKRLTLSWQSRCSPLAAFIEEVELLRENYMDKPGVVWQGQRWGLGRRPDT